MGLMDVLITGGNGLLGSALCLEFIKKYKVTCCYRSSAIEIVNENFKSLKIDIATGSLSEIEEASPDIIIHAAALTDLELCEKNPGLAHEVNVNGTKNVLEAAKKCGAKLVYVCTDYIFDGKRGQYSEIDEPNPISVYAKTKLQGEEVIVKNYDDFLSIRTSLHGWNPNPIKSSLSSSIINSSRKKEVFFVTDQISSLMFTGDFANILIELLERNLTGIYNVASSDSMSKYHFSIAVAEMFNLSSDFIKPVSLDEFKKKFSLVANRPKNISLNVSKVEDALGKRMCTILEGIVSMKEKEADFKKAVRWLDAN
jgi:dTDP-4-dehydrorhamnose reductase